MRNHCIFLLPITPSSSPYAFCLSLCGKTTQVGASSILVVGPLTSWHFPILSAADIIMIAIKEGITTRIDEEPLSTESKIALSVYQYLKGGILDEIKKCASGEKLMDGGIDMTFV